MIRIILLILFQLLPKQASVRGFLLFLNAKDYKPYMKNLVDLVNSGQIKSHVDLGKQAPTGPFLGIDSIVDAVEVNQDNILVIG